MGKFVIYRKPGYCYFQLRAENGEVIAASEGYTTLASCKNGIQSIRRAALKAKLEDQTQPGYRSLTNPKFEIFLDKSGEYRFRLRARNGEIVAASQGYATRDVCLLGIDSIRRNAPDAPVEIEKEE